ncbi:MAG: hypothetical protein R6V57_15295 [Vicinamibacterales bacterium]
MTRRMLWALGLTLVLAAPGLARAGEVRLSIKDGRVALVARDATLREILVEWERVGGTRIVNRDRVPGTRLTLEFADVSEEQVLTTLLRPMAGYMASRRIGPEGGASAFSRIVLMPALATPASAGVAPPARAAGPSGGGNQPGTGGPPFGRPGMQRRVLPDGRVVTVMDDPLQAEEPDDALQERPVPPGMMRPPFSAPPRPQGEAGSDAPASAPELGQVTPTGSTAPTLPQQTVGKPGLLPAAKPGTTPPPPIKPPGD